MVFDLEMIKNIYSSMKEKVDRAKNICKHPLTLSEKILYSHLWSNIEKRFERGVDYVAVSYTHLTLPTTVDV